MADRAQEPKRIANVLTIAGLDPSGGAGILADVKAMSACGTYGMAVVAALTAQNTCGVTGWQPVAPDFVRAQIDAIFEDIRVDAVKIGMLGTPEVIEAVAQALERHRPPFVVLDPVMVAKGGDRLLAEEAETALCERLLPLTSVITPNLPEAAVLACEPEIRERAEMPALAKKLLGRLAAGAWVYLKGGHLTESASPDFLLSRETSFTFDAPRIATKNTHGTGCTLSAAIAAQLGRGESVPEAVRKAKAYVYEAIARADELEVGHGHGPTNHFAALWRDGGL
jgi:hydroxymethylpyrimidine/phosphomethylpyrimidine kinase